MLWCACCFNAVNVSLFTTARQEKILNQHFFIFYFAAARTIPFLG